MRVQFDPKYNFKLVSKTNRNGSDEMGTVQVKDNNGVNRWLWLHKIRGADSVGCRRPSPMWMCSACKTHEANFRLARGAQAAKCSARQLEGLFTFFQLLKFTGLRSN